MNTNTYVTHFTNTNKYMRIEIYHLIQDGLDSKEANKSRKRGSFLDSIALDFQKLSPLPKIPYT